MLESGGEPPTTAVLRRARRRALAVFLALVGLAALLAGLGVRWEVWITALTTGVAAGVAAAWSWFLGRVAIGVGGRLQ